MIRIAITPAAMWRSSPPLPGNVGVERARAENGSIKVASSSSRRTARSEGAAAEAAGTLKIENR
jgi:hypothetical protein